MRSGQGTVRSGHGQVRGRSGQGTVRSGHGSSRRGTVRSGHGSSRRGTGHHGGARSAGHGSSRRGTGQRAVLAVSRERAKSRKNGLTRAKIAAVRCLRCGNGDITAARGARGTVSGARGTGYGVRGTAPRVAPCCALSRPVVLRSVALLCCALLLSLSVALCCVSRRACPCLGCCALLRLSVLRLVACCGLLRGVLHRVAGSPCCGLLLLLRFVADGCPVAVCCGALRRRGILCP